jgi:hypothetical protein
MENSCGSPMFRSGMTDYIYITNLEQHTRIQNKILQTFDKREHEPEYVTGTMLLQHLTNSVTKHLLQG